LTLAGLMARAAEGDEEAVGVVQVSLHRFVAVCHRLVGPSSCCASLGCIQGGRCDKGLAA
jgi:hypothetical protein